MIELLLAMIALAVLAVISLPAIGRIRSAAAVQNARYGVESTFALARATAMRYGRPALVRLDPPTGRIWVEVDTTVAGMGTALDTVVLLHLSDDFGVDLQSDRLALCFDGRGIGTTGTACPVVGAHIVLSRAGRADTLQLSAVGRVLP